MTNSYKIGRDELSISNILYADDVMVLTNGTSRSLKAFIRLTKKYERSFGKLINIEKSSFYVGNRSRHRVPFIARIMGMGHKEFPLWYLGVPISAGRNKLLYFEHLVDKVIAKLDGWKAQLLSFARKLPLIKTVLSSIPIYTLDKLDLGVSPQGGRRFGYSQTLIYSMPFSRQTVVVSS